MPGLDSRESFTILTGSDLKRTKHILRPPARPPSFFASAAAFKKLSTSALTGLRHGDS
jgi:hypothetical protein